MVTPEPVVTPAGTALTAGLVEAGSWVNVGPPLFARVPSCGLWPMMSPVAGVPQLESSIKLWPAECSEPPLTKQLFWAPPDMPPATMLSPRSRALPPCTLRLPP